jgi:hypothetical protein
MCLFITLALPAGADVPLLDSLAARYGRCLVPLRNDSVERQLPPGAVYCRTTIGHCDCDNALGRAARAGSDQDHEERARRWRRKGWSEAKIARALENSADSTQVHAGNQDLAQWRGFLGALLGHGLARVHLLLHWYSADLEDPIALAAPMSHRFEDLAPERLGALELDVLHEIRR